MNLNFNSLFKTTFFILFSLLATVNVATATESKMVQLSVPGMTCEFCPITIRKALNKVPGVIKATSDFATKSATVTFDPSKTNIETLTKATANAGYPSTVNK